MPQHWQTSLCGEPSRVLMDTLNRFDSCFSVSVFGTVSPFSQRETAWRVTKTLSASSSCDRPFFVLSSYNTSFVPIEIPP